MTADNKSDEKECSHELQEYVKAAVHFMLFPNGDPHDWEQELTANSIMESYGQVLMLTEYELTAYATTVAQENYPKLAAFVKAVHHKMVADLIALSPDPFVTALLEADSIYREYEDRRAADGCEHHKADEVEAWVKKVWANKVNL